MSVGNGMRVKNNLGYGQFGVGGKTQKAHRVSYSYFVGDVPKERLVLHSCDNRSCVNPNHLRIGTQKDNMDDMVIRKRHWVFGKSLSKKTRNKMSNAKKGIYEGEDNPRSKLNDEKVLKMKYLHFEEGYSFVKLGRKYKVSTATVRCAILGITWGHLK